MCMTDREPPYMTSLGLGDTERDWLVIMRLNCLSFEHNDAEGWNRAISHAESIYGAAEGPVIAARIAGMIRAMRSERNGGFGYLSPFCPNCRQRVTEDEWQLVCLMKAGRDGTAGEVEAAAADVARRPSAPMLVAAAQLFGAEVTGTRGVRHHEPAPLGATLH